MAMAGDSDILTDFIVPQNVTDVDGTFFTFTGLRALYGGGPSTTHQVSKVSLAEFPALNGQSVSYAVLGYPAGTTNPPHTHPRATELLFVVLAIAAFGSANAGTVSIPNTLFTTGIDDVVLAKSFKTNTTTIEALKAGLAPSKP
nr:germin-like protein 9-3 [Quercus suber]